MALLFHDSFDDRTSNVHLKYDGWRVVNGSPFAPSSASGITGLTNLGILFGVGGFGQDYLDKAIPARQTVIVAFRWRFQTAPGAPERILELFDGSTSHLYVVRNAGNPAGTLSVYRGDNTLLGTTTDTVDYNLVAHLQLKVTIHDTAGAFELRINGVSVLSVSNVDTRNGGNASISTVRFGSLSGGVATYVDDFALFDTTGPRNNDFPGNYKIAYLAPSGAGTHSDFARTGGSASGNYTAVNELNYDDDSSFVASGNVGDTDTYAMANLADNTVTIKAVTVFVRARKDDNLSRSIAPVILSNASTQVGADLSMTTSYQNFYGILYETNPATGLSWVGSDIDAMELGVKVTA